MFVGGGGGGGGGSNAICADVGKCRRGHCVGQCKGHPPWQANVGKCRRGHCVGQCKGHPPWHIPKEFVQYITMHTVSGLYKENLNVN